jgi:hypothetical protein
MPTILRIVNAYIYLMSKYFLKQRIPWVSLSLLISSYAVAGRFLHQVQQPLLIVLFVSGYIVINFFTLVPIAGQVTGTIRSRIGSESINLLSFLAVAFLAIIILVKVAIFGNLLLIFTAEILIRLDFQQIELSPLKRSLVLAMCLVVGLGLGWMTGELALISADVEAQHK